jgi:murein DD-endopeptidase MepM/ murein hydrolase activator NlpD
VKLSGWMKSGRIPGARLSRPEGVGLYNGSAVRSRRSRGSRGAIILKFAPWLSSSMGAIIAVCLVAAAIGAAPVIMSGEASESDLSPLANSLAYHLTGADEYSPFCIPDDPDFARGGPEEILFGETTSTYHFSLIPRFSDPPIHVCEHTISKNDSLSQKLQSDGVPYSLILQWVDISKDMYDFSRVRPGQSYCLWKTKDDDFVRLSYQINSREELVIAKKSNGYNVSRQYVDPGLDGERDGSYPWPEWTDDEKGYNYYRGSIKNNFYSSAIKSGMTPAQAMIMIKIFSDVNFSRDLQAGDNFSVVTEMGENPYEEGPIVGAMLEVNGKPHYMYRYSEKDSSGYYNEKGKSLKKSTFICPIRYKRISSLFTYRRYHPILHTYRPHLGVDFAAPTGTSIWASADGVVERIGYRGGFGHSVTIRHQNGVKSMYNHLSRYKKGLKKGQKVKQGHTIAYCGSTGMSTGPHLDYRVFKEGKAVNPLKITSLGGTPVKDTKSFDAFRKKMDYELKAEVPLGPPLAYFHDCNKQENGASSIKPGGVDYDTY